MFSLDVFMSTDLVTVGPSDTLEKARSLMNQNRIRHLPVVNRHGALVGLLTQTDVLAATDSILRATEERLPVTRFPVEDVMVTKLATVDPRASLRQAAMYLEANRIGCLPVVDDGRLVGIITDTDFVGVAINLLEQLEEEEPDEYEPDEFEPEELDLPGDEDRQP